MHLPLYMSGRKEMRASMYVSATGIVDTKC